MALADKFRLFSPTVVERQIGDHVFRFSPVRGRTLARLGPLLSKLAGQMSVLFGSDKQDQAQEVEDYVGPDGARVSKTKIQAVNPDLARLRAEQRSKAVSAAVESLLDDKNRVAIGELLMCSLREDFPRGPTADGAAELMADLDLDVLRQMLGGLLEANAKILGDVGNALRRAVLEKAGELLGEVKPAAESPAAG